MHDYEAKKERKPYKMMKHTFQEEGNNFALKLDEMWSR